MDTSYQKITETLFRTMGDHCDILCICLRGQNRSRQAAGYLGSRAFYAGADEYAFTPVTQPMIDRCSAVVIMEPSLLEYMTETRRLDFTGKRLVVLDVSDVRIRDADELTSELIRQLSPHVPYILREAEEYAYV